MYHPSYTIITGASEGFGKSLAFECASRKMNLILVALPGPELNCLSSFIRRNYGVEVIPIGKDLSHENNCHELYAEITAMKLQVNILINNAGIGNTLHFAEGCPLFYEKQIKLNVLATTLITKLFLDTLRQSKRSYI